MSEVPDDLIAELRVALAAMPVPVSGEVVPPAAVVGRVWQAAAAIVAHSKIAGPGDSDSPWG